MTGDIELLPRDGPQAVQQQGLHLDPAQAEQIRGGHLEVSWDWRRPGHVTTLPVSDWSRKRTSRHGAVDWRRRRRRGNGPRSLPTRS